jgi:dihydroorotase
VRMDLIIEGRAFVNGHLEQCCIGIDGGRIIAIKKDLRGGKRLDLQGQIILPGAIDPHVHLRDPGSTQKEDFRTGTLSAAFGGVTCVFDMPNTLPATQTMEALREKRAIGNSKAWVDFGLFGGLVPGSDVLDLAPEVIGLKMFMGSSTQSNVVTEDEDIVRLAGLVKRAGKVLSVHAEEESMIRRDRVETLEGHNRNRSPDCEVQAIRRLLDLVPDAPLNICHVSTAAGLKALQGSVFTKEVTTHHMLLDERSDLGGKGKVNPPLRSTEDREAILQSFISGKVDMLASDHAPHLLDEKRQEFTAVPSGVPGVETSVPLMLNLVKKGKLDLGLLVRCCAQRPAERFGLKKGRLAVGYDADIMVIDPGKVVRIEADELHSRCAWTPYERFEAIFPDMVFLRGDALIEEGNIVGERKGRDVVAAASISG